MTRHCECPDTIDPDGRCSRCGLPRDSVTISRAEYEALMAAANAADHLAAAEALYRKAHDLHGDDSPITGRAWDLMRREGDKVREFLVALRATGIQTEGEKK